jgi:uncharacterized OsmC-like protein
MKTNLSPETINGVDLEQLTNTVKAVQEQPSLGDCQFRARGRWIDGGHNRTRIDGFYGAGQEHKRPEPFVFDKDEPPVLLGKDIGANPVEFVLTALAGCTTTSMAYHGAANGVEIESIETKLEGDLDLRGFLNLAPEARKGFDGIRVKYKVKSDADAEKLRQFIAQSPVLDIITNPTPVSIEIEKI